MTRHSDDPDSTEPTEPTYGLPELFSSLTADPPPSKLSPLAVMAVARDEASFRRHRSRNWLVGSAAAVVIGVAGVSYVTSDSPPNSATAVRIDAGLSGVGLKNPTVSNESGTSPAGSAPDRSTAASSAASAHESAPSSNPDAAGAPHSEAPAAAATSESGRLPQSTNGGESEPRCQVPLLPESVIAQFVSKVSSSPTTLSLRQSVSAANIRPATVDCDLAEGARGVAFHTVGSEVLAGQDVQLVVLTEQPPIGDSVQLFAGEQFTYEGKPMWLVNVNRLQSRAALIAQAEGVWIQVELTPLLITTTGHVASATPDPSSATSSASTTVEPESTIPTSGGAVNQTYQEMAQLGDILAAALAQ